MMTSEINDLQTKISGSYFVAQWYVQPKLNKLSSADNDHVIEPRLIEVLTYLAERPQQVISRTELIAALWQGRVSDGAVNRVIAKLRKYLGDNTENPIYIKTVAKQGYQLIAPVILSENSSHNKKITSAKARNYAKALIATIFILIFYFLFQYITASSPQKLKVTVQPLTSQKGNESAASLSNDGQWLAYAYQKDILSPRELFIKSSDNEQIIQLTNNNFNISAPAFSSSSKSIAYFEKNFNVCHLVLMTLDDEMRPLTETQVATCDASEHFSTLAWSADDKKLIYTDRKSPESPYLIQQLSLDTGRIQNLSHVPDSFYGDYGIAMDREGKKLAFLRSKYWDNSELYVMDMTSLVVEKVWQFDFLVWSVSFLDDGTIIYSDGKSPSNLYKLNFTKQKVEHIYSSTGFIFNPKRTNVLSNIIYNQINFEADIWHKDLKNEGLATRVETNVNSSFIDEKPAISKDAKSLAFLSNREGELALWIKKATKLFPLKSLDSSIRLDAYSWLPDNKKLIVATGNNKILLVDTEKDHTTLVKTINDIAVHPSLSPDGHWLYYSSDNNGDWQVWKQAIATESTPELITPNGGYQAIEHNDGVRLFFTKYQELGLWQMNLKTKKESLLIKDLTRRTQFKVCEDSIYFSKEKDNKTQVWQYLFSTKQQTLIFESALDMQMTYDINNACSSMYYSIWQGESNIMLLKTK